MQRNIKEKDQTIKSLNQKITELLDAAKTRFDATSASRAGSRQLGLRNNSVMRARDVGSRSHNRVGGLGGSITSRGRDHSRSPSNIPIQEVEENFEMSGYNFGNQNMYRDGNDGLHNGDGWHSRHQSLPLDDLDDRNAKKN